MIHALATIVAVVVLSTAAIITVIRRTDPWV